MYNCRIGVISDTHGLVRPEVIKVLKDTDLIIHAGDVGTPEVIKILQSVAPVIAVRGNMDTGNWATELLKHEIVKIGGISLLILHDAGELDINPAAASFSAVISGHTHIPSVKEQNGVLFLNPGSAGQRRFKLPVSIALLNVKGNSLDAELIEIKVS